MAPSKAVLAGGAAGLGVLVFLLPRLLSKRKSLKEVMIKGHGLELWVSPFGATITRLLVSDKDGKMEDVTLGYDTVEQYDAGKHYFGCVVGRVANRIANGSFSIDGKPYKVPVNNGKHSLHGGPNGFHRKWWDMSPLPENEGPGVRLTYVSKAGEEGYPGEVSVTVVYRLTNHQGRPSLVTEMSASLRSGQATPVNLAQHTYWNLAGHKSGSVLNHEIRIFGDRYTPVGEDLIPTGEIASVANTPFDFAAKERPIGESIGKVPGGYDHNYVLSGPNALRAASAAPAKLSVAAWVHEPKSGRIMELLTDAPGLQFYTGNFLAGEPGKDGATYAKHGGFCLETQHFPDSVNQPKFPSVIITPGHPYLHTMVLRFHNKKLTNSASSDMLPPEQLRGGVSFRKVLKDDPTLSPAAKARTSSVGRSY